MFKTMMKITMVSTLALSTANCGTLPNTAGSGFCSGEDAPLCLFLALAIGGAIFAIVGPSYVAHIVHVSDERLKTDVTYYKTTSNGIKLYGFRYKGDDRVFIGVVAQELLKDKRFAGAVTRGKDGYYRVNYGKLGLQLKAENLMLEAGTKAIAHAG